MGGIFAEKKHKKGADSLKNKLLEPTKLYDETRRRLSQLKCGKELIEKRMMKFPPGRIHIINRQGKYQFYLRTDPKDKSGKYISKKDKAKLSIFLQKKYYNDILKLICFEISMIEDFIKKTESISKKIQMLYSNESKEIKELLSPIDISDDDYIEEWLSIPYEKKDVTGVPDDYITEKGEIVRSKSELNIANYLYKMNIPYRYECRLEFSNGFRIYPDFTILDIKRRREIYWEHRGMMDNPEYVRDTVERIKRYEKDGFYLGDSVIITEETLSCHLGTVEIKSIIDHYFISN